MNFMVLAIKCYVINDDCDHECYNYVYIVNGSAYGNRIFLMKKHKFLI